MKKIPLFDEMETKRAYDDDNDDDREKEEDSMIGKEMREESLDVMHKISAKKINLV